MAITEGSRLHPLKGLADGARATWFTPQLDPHAARKRWILAMKPQGALVIDDGAARALQRGTSLLPPGIVKVSGKFGRGDPVTIKDATGRELGMGLSRYTASEAQAIKGHNSAEIEEILGYPGRAVVIHRDDMAI
jgi:glutamate 5-kinase